MQLKNVLQYLIKFYLYIKLCIGKYRDEIYDYGYLLDLKY